MRNDLLVQMIKEDAYIEKAVMDIAKMILKVGKERDIISFAHDMVFIATNSDQDTLNYMNSIGYNDDFNRVEAVNNKNRHGLLLRYKYKYRNLPIMIMKVKRLSEHRLYHNVEFEVSIVDEFNDLVTVPLGLSIAEEVLK